MQIDSFSLWAPGLESKDDWNLWANDKKEILDSEESPQLSFASPITTRRFSQITRITCYLAHLLGLNVDTFFFSSVRGEIGIQYKINNDFAKENELKPATFTLSVFNTAPAEATILLNSQTPYTPIFSGMENTFKNLFKVGTAPLRAGRLNSVLLIYAEERTPVEYRNNLSKKELPPMGIGIKISKDDSDNFIPESVLSDAKSLINYLINEKSEIWLQ